jgi:hypothetical protein
MTRPKIEILVDGGDPQETRQVKELLGFVDGQTTETVAGSGREICEFRRRRRNSQENISKLECCDSVESAER